MNHPYWITLTVAVGLIALAAATFLGCLARWAWLKGSYQRAIHQTLLGDVTDDQIRAFYDQEQQR